MKKTFKANEIQNFPTCTGVYSISFVNSKSKKQYVGSAARINGKYNSDMGFYSRWRKHLIQLRSNVHHSFTLQKAYNKYGDDNIEFKILKKCSSDKCIVYEQHYIDKFNSFKRGYNGRPNAANNSGTNWTLIRKQNYSDKFKKIRSTYLKLILDLYVQNKSTREISKTLKISRTFIQKIFKDHNIKTKSVGYTRRKPIVQYDMNGKRIKEWISILDCCQSLKINRNSVRQVLNGTCKQTKGFYFTYKD